MASKALVQIDLQGKLEKLASGKVRDLFIIDEKSLLFVASDRISAYDVIMKNVSLFPVLYLCSVLRFCPVLYTVNLLRLMFHSMFIYLLI